MQNELDAVYIDTTCTADERMRRKGRRHEIKKLVS